MFRFGHTVVRYQQQIVKPSLWQRVKNEAHHFWTGGKLLVTETGISYRLLKQRLNGKELTHREHRQLKRTSIDLLRTVPFLAFVLIPFSEPFLPIVIKLFPNFLPSTFRDDFSEQESRKKLLGVRLQMASFLRETFEETKQKEGELGSFVKLLNNMQPSVQQDEAAIVDTPELLKLCQNFKDNVTKDHLSRQQLISICRYFAIPGIGTTEMIRRNVSRRINKIQQEDHLILQDAIRLMPIIKTEIPKEEQLPETPSTLMDVITEIPIPELQTLCKERGIPISSPRRMRLELKQWVELSVVYKVPNILLVLSRILMVDMQFKAASTPLGADVKPSSQNINASGLSQETLSVLQDTLKTLPETVIKDTMLDIARERGDKGTVLASIKEEMIEIEKESKARIEEEEKKKIEKEVEEAISPPAKGELSEGQKNELASVLRVMMNQSIVQEEKQLLKDIVENNTEKESSKITSLIDKISDEIAQLDTQVGDSLNLVKPNPKGQITINDLRMALKTINHPVTDAEADLLVDKFDVDKDGLVSIEEMEKQLNLTIKSD